MIYKKAAVVLKHAVRQPRHVCRLIDFFFVYTFENKWDGEDDLVSVFSPQTFFSYLTQLCARANNKTLRLAYQSLK